MASLRSYFFNKVNNTKEVLTNFFWKKKKFESTTLFSRQREDFDKKLVYSLSKSRIPNLTQLKYFFRFLNKTELWLVRVCFILIILSSGFLLNRFYVSHLKISPVLGGEYTEGLLGEPKYINPLYANLSDVDSDLAHLIFSSLLRHDQDGNLVNDLAESYEISEDNKQYIFKIKNNVKWHNGNNLNADDIIFTFNAIKDPGYKSSLRLSYAGVEIEKVDDYSIKFILSEPYAAFLDTLVFGIMPQEAWLQINPQTANLAELNLKPIGSGSYKFKALTKDKSGVIRSFTLVSNTEYYLTPAKVESLTFKFFYDSTEAITALNAGEVDGLSYLPKLLEGEIKNSKQYNFQKLNLPQLTVLFFNTNNNLAFAEKEVRWALSYAINKPQLIQDVLSQDARQIDGPILPENFAFNDQAKKYDFNQTEANSSLDKVGWKIVDITKVEITKAQEDVKSKDEAIKNQAQQILDLGEGKWRKKKDSFLMVKLTTVDRGENSAVVEQIKKYWEQVNVKTITELLPVSQIYSDIIKPRKFEALFYGQVVGADPDPYAFWHSSQAANNGFNIVNFSNKEVDQLLEDARTTMDKNVRLEKYKKFQEILAEEQPAIFIYSPLYTYLQNKEINGFVGKNIQLPYDRFDNITDWYLKVKKAFHW